MFTVPSIPAFDEAAAASARVRQDDLTKPPGSLGRLEELAIWYAGARGRFPVPVPGRGEVFVFAADHGVAADGVSAYPPAVTAAMVENFRRGGAAINVLARQIGLRVTVVDVGVGTDDVARGSGVADRTGDRPVGSQAEATDFWPARIRPGTRNLRLEAALTLDEAERALRVGMRAARTAVERGADLLVGGDMGIGNTTPATALLCVLSGAAPEEVVGRGTGLDAAGLERKRGVLRAALARHAATQVAAGAGHGETATDGALSALASVGGLEIAALAGMMLAGASARVPTVVDGFIAGSAALVATRLAPAVRPYLLLSHLSAERGAARLCDALTGPRPLLDLGMRLGEGSGAAMAVPLLRAAVALQNEMATFASAHVPRG